MDKKRKPNSYWNYDRVKEIAKKCNSRSEFAKNHPYAYQFARKNNWLDKWFGYVYISWDYESTKKEAKKYKTRNEFNIKNNHACQIARKNGWLDEWFPYQVKFWNYKNVECEARKYVSRTKFSRGCRGAYQAAHRNKTEEGVLDINVQWSDGTTTKAPYMNNK